MSPRSSLSGRLSRLKKDGLSPPVKKEVTTPKKTVEPLPGWQQVTPYLWKRSVTYDNPLPSGFSGSLLIPNDSAPASLIFYDTETTGLSTGAGTIPFLIGLGCLDERGFTVIQYFLADYPGEKDMLEALKKDFSQGSVFVSYNGKTYDSHLINTRFLMNGISIDSRFEVDLLYMCRRLWKNILKDCRLGTIEEAILSIERGPDIPGAEIPDVWFDFLKTDNREKLKLVFSHNLQDIYTLAILLSRLEEIIAGNDSCQYDLASLGRFLLLHGRSEGEDLIMKEMEKGNREAGIYLSLYLKRQERWDEALTLWERLNSKGCHFFSVEELAKYYEHKVKDPAKALSIVDVMLKGPIPLSTEIKEKLTHRKKRLLRKLEMS